MLLPLWFFYQILFTGMMQGTLLLVLIKNAFYIHGLYLLNGNFISFIRY